MFFYANRVILNRSPWRSYKRTLSNSIVFAIIVIIAKQIPWNLNSYFSIILWACFSGVLILLVYFAVASLINQDSYNELKLIVKSVLHKKQQKEKADLL